MDRRITIEDVLERLRGVRKQGQTRATARCPAHKDRDPSLSISEGRTCILLHCHAGCSFDDIVRALGFDKTDMLYEVSPTGTVYKTAWAREAESVRQAALKLESWREDG